ncbi:MULTISPECIES: hypothetical protein [unclassified Haladaptatus]|uniref:hypothetical protein n=1 Tax=unclassified Haladaptatus TaxID=2622732 RepID=UPI0023E8571E|nr:MULTISPECIES: hypothetical protein [unclassified Haladaptatus]
MVSFPFAGGPDLAVLVVFFLVCNTVFAIAAGRYVYRDAHRRGKSRAPVWGLLVGALFLVNVLTGAFGLFAYLFSRS